LGQLSTPLFRKEAQAGQNKSLGTIVLIRPLSFTALTVLFALFSFLLCAFAYCKTYTKHSTVLGRLVPDTGLIKAYAIQPGIVRKKAVVEGQAVRQGDTLFILSSERHSAEHAGVQAAISNQVQLRQGSLREERDKTRAMQLEERNALQAKIAGMQAQLAKSDSEISGQQARVKLAEETVARYQGLLKQDYVTREQAQQKDEDLLDQRNRLQSLERDRIALDGQIKGEQANLASLGLKQQNQLALLDRDLASTSQELTESEARRELVVTAPESGIVTAITAEPGQNVDTSHPLASIVPTGAKMQAYLYASSKAIGFIKPGDQVLLRYQAYPYQKFGHAKGIVTTVSRTALPAAELDANLGGNNNEPLYRVVVDLATQSVIAYGKPQPLQAGMLLDADVMQDKRRLYEWVLEPLYSLTGKL